MKLIIIICFLISSCSGVPKKDQEKFDILDTVGTFYIDNFTEKTILNLKKGEFEFHVFTIVGKSKKPFPEIINDPKVKTAYTLITGSILQEGDRLFLYMTDSSCPNNEYIKKKNRISYSWGDSLLNVFWMDTTFNTEFEYFNESYVQVSPKEHGKLMKFKPRQLYVDVERCKYLNAKPSP